VDWRLYQPIYDVSLHHHWVGTLFSDIEKVSIPLMVVMTAALWFFSRPGGDRKWKLACGSAFASAALAYAAAFAIHQAWSRPRPYLATSIAVGRLFIGAHYPSDVAMGLVIGLLAAGVVVRLLPRFVSWVVSQVERVSDPLVRPLWR
jgi:membrane-associated phospholipid phosphatase